MRYFLTLVDAFEPGGRPFLLSELRQLSPEERRSIRATSGVRHAAAHSFMEIAAAACCRRLLDVMTVNPGRVGVVSTAGSVQLPVAWALTRGLLEDGIELLNPLPFPHSIPSSLPTTVAAHCQVTAFALAMGHDQLAFGEVLEASMQLLRAGMADAVLIIAAWDSDAPLDRAACAAGERTLLADVCICGVLSTEPLLPDTVSISQVVTTRPAARDLRETGRLPHGRVGARRYEIRDGCIRESSEGRTLAPDLFLASGSVVLLDSIRTARSRSAMEVEVELRSLGVSQLFVLGTRYPQG